MGSTQIENGKAENRRLLVVDDSDINRAIAVTILGRLGYPAVGVDGGTKAIEAVRSEEFAAILMDIWMPGMDGFDVTGAIRKLPAPNGEVPVIAMTAHAGAEERQRCLDFGMAEHVAKPINRAQLAAVLQRIVGPASDAGVAVGGAVGGDTRGTAFVSDQILEQLRQDAGPALVRELVAAYMAETEERLNRIAAGVKSADLGEVAADAHSLKSSSGTFGALLLQDLAHKLESAATQGDADAVGAFLAELSQLVADTWSAFNSRGFRQG